MAVNKKYVLSTEISVKRLTHSYQEDLERISWNIRSTDTPTFVDGKWIWPTGEKGPTAVESVQSTTFPLRLTHSYAPTLDYSSTTIFSSEQTSTIISVSTEQSFLTELMSTAPMLNDTVVNDDPVVVLADISSVLYEDSQSSLPGKDKMIICIGHLGPILS